MRILLFLGFLALSMLVPIGLAQAQAPKQGGINRFICHPEAGIHPDGFQLLEIDGMRQII